MGLAILVLGLVVFLTPHTLTAFRSARQSIVDRLGEGPYKAIYSVVSLIGVVLIGHGFAVYRATGWIDVWYPPTWTRHLAVALVWPAIICIAAAYATGRIKATLKHPFLVGIKLWTVAHLIANGDLGSIILFGAILAWAVFDRISLKHRSDLGGPPIPIGGVGSDIIAVIAGTIVYFLLGYYVHPYVIGVPVFMS